MPGLLRKLVIIAAVDGLILQSSGNGLRHSGNNEPSSLRIDYKTNKVSSLPAPASDLDEDRDSGLEAYGLVGKQPISCLNISVAVLCAGYSILRWRFISRSVTEIPIANVQRAVQRAAIRCVIFFPHLYHSAATSGSDTGQAHLCCD